MPRISISSFGSSAPRVAEHLTQSAALALDAKLWSGRLSSWHEPKKIRDVGTAKTVALLGCCWRHWDTCVDVAFGPVNCDRWFITGAAPHAQVMDLDENCAPRIRRLGIPCPNNAPQVSAAAAPDAPDKDYEGRAYAYQYINEWGERGALSRASHAELVKDGQPVVVSGWAVPSADWGVTHIGLYRSVTGHQSGREAGNSQDTYWVLVDEIPVGQGAYTDTKWNDDLNRGLEEDVANPPPDGLRGIIWLEGWNTLAGFKGNRVYFTENNSYHKWNHYLDLDDNVCALAEANGVVYAITDGRPYAIESSANCEAASCRSVSRLPGVYPLAGGGNRRVATTAAGVVYPSSEGLILLSGNREPQVLTWARYSPDEWQALVPESITPVLHGARLFVFGQGGSFILRISSTESGWGMDDHAELSDKGVLDAFVTRQGRLFFLKDGAVWEWDKGTELRPHQWVSPEFVTAAPVNYNAGNVALVGEERLRVMCDRRLALDRTFVHNQPFRLTRQALGTRWQIELSGTGDVSLVTLASSMEELGT